MLLKKYYFLGLYSVFLTFGYLFFYGLSFESFRIFFWFSHISLLLIGIGFFIRSSLLISTMFIISVPFEFFWLIQFITTLFGIIGGTNNFILGYSIPEFIFTFFFHLNIIPLAIYGVYKFKFNKNSLFFALILFNLFILPISYYLSSISENENINCVYKSCSIEENSFSFLKDFHMTIYFLIYKMFLYSLITSLSYLFWLKFFKKRNLITN